jgi:hypothetical protein
MRVVLCTGATVAVRKHAVPYVAGTGYATVVKVGRGRVSMRDVHVRWSDGSESIERESDLRVAA